MQFNSYVFILAFLPIVVCAYYLLSRVHATLGKLVLIAGSLVFYGYADVKVLQLLLLSMAVNYVLALLIRKLPWKKLLFPIPVIVNIGLLVYFKYTNFILTNINSWFNAGFALKELVLPLGISFFTFQQIAYVTAIYSGKLEKVSFLDYAAYILYFPKILMGPLMEPADFIGQLNDPALKKPSVDRLAGGIKIFSFGLFKKVLLADTFAAAVSWAFSNMEAATSMDWIIAVLCYTFEIYFDFSGYSDMAVGASALLNITLPINFDSPYKAVSIRDFWKRWHISLTKFLTNYIYIPLGGSRKGLLMTCLNTLFVFLISGIWHGANWTFILWGLLHGALSIFDRFVEKRKIYEPARWLLTFLVINALWLLFRADSVGQWLEILKKILCFENTTVSAGLISSFKLPESGFIMKCLPFLSAINTASRGFIMNTFLTVSALICFFPENNYRNKDRLTFVGMLLAAAAFIWGMTCLGSESVFVYFNF